MYTATERKCETEKCESLSTEPHLMSDSVHLCAFMYYSLGTTENLPNSKQLPM